MNALSMPPVPLLPPEDQPVWSDFDLLDLHNLSSPASWVSNADAPSKPTTLTLDPPPAPPAAALDALTPAVPAAAAAAAHPLAHAQQLFDEMQRQHVAALSAYTSITTDATASPSEPDCGQIVDSALDFQPPVSPLSSDIPLHCLATAAVHSVESSLLPTDFAPQPPLVPDHRRAATCLSNAPAPLPSPPYTANRSESRSSPTSATSNQCTSATSAQSPQSPQSCKLVTSFPPAKPSARLHGRVQKQTRRYTAPKSSRYCHLCARHERSVTMVPCGNVELGLCQKSVCTKCISIYKLEVSESSWACPHCQNRCPSRAKCFAYDRQTARRREKTMKAKMSAISQPSSGPVRSALQ